MLKSLIGKTIISAKRQLYVDDWDLPDYEQTADGPVELALNDGRVVHFIALTELFSVGVAADLMPRYGEGYELRDVSLNPFWSTRVRQRIKQLSILKCDDSSEDFPCEVGVDIGLMNGERVVIQYKSEVDYPDMINISGNRFGERYNIQRIE